MGNCQIWYWCCEKDSIDQQIQLSNKIHKVQDPKTNYLIKQTPETQEDKYLPIDQYTRISDDLINIPKATSLIKTEEQIQKRQLQILEYGSCLEHYKNFNLVRIRNVDDQLVSKDLFEAISIILFEALAHQPEKLRRIKNSIIFLPEFYGLRKTIAQYSMDYGQVIQKQQILKLFLQYLVLLIKGQISGISIIQKYTIMQSALQKIVISYMISKHNNDKNQILSEYMKQQFPQSFINRVLNTFQIKYQWVNDKMLLLKSNNYEASIHIKSHNCFTTIKIPKTN